MLSLNTPNKQLLSLRDRFKQRRLSLNYTQNTLSVMAGVSLGSIKRFESSGEISLKSLLKLSLTLECLDDFSTIALKDRTEEELTIKELQEQSKKRQRASK